MKIVAKLIIVVLVSGGLLGSNVFGQGSVFAQASFEGISGSVSSPGLVSLSTNSGTIGSWTATAAGLVGVPSSVTIGVISGGPAPADGTNIARLSMPLGVGDATSLSQTSTTALMPNTIYNLSVSLDQGTTLGLINNANLSLMAGSTTLATLSGATLASLLDSSVGFQTVNLSYTTGATVPGGNIGVAFNAGSTLSVFGSIYLDNLNLSLTPTPEPSAMALLIPACGVFALHRWRRNTGSPSLKPTSLSDLGNTP